MLIEKGTEQYWMKTVAEDKEFLKKMEEEIELNPGLYSKRDLQLTRSFINFMETVFKYDNLKLGEHGEIHKRLIRLHRNIPVGELEFMNIDHIIFNGLYVIADVMFISASECKKFYNNHGRVS